MIKQTAGRDQLGTFAPKFTQLNDDILFGEVWNRDDKLCHEKSMIFPIGAFNDGFAQYFSGKSFLAPISNEQMDIFNVTFEPGCHNNWHIHNAASGGGQILVCVNDRG